MYVEGSEERCYGVAEESPTMQTKGNYAFGILSLVFFYFLLETLNAFLATNLSMMFLNTYTHTHRDRFHIFHLYCSSD